MVRKHDGQRQILASFSYLKTGKITIFPVIRVVWVRLYFIDRLCDCFKLLQDSSNEIGICAQQMTLVLRGLSGFVTGRKFGHFAAFLSATRTSASRLAPAPNSSLAAATAALASPGLKPRPVRAVTASARGPGVVGT